MLRLLTASIVVALVALASASSVAAQGDCAMSLEPSRIAVGESVTVTALGFSGDIDIVVTSEDGDREVHSFSEDPAQVFRKTLGFDVPGTYTVQLILRESECGAGARLVVTMPETSSLVSTSGAGGSPAPLLAFAGALGLLLAYVVNRRARATA